MVKKVKVEFNKVKVKSVWTLYGQYGSSIHRDADDNFVYFFQERSKSGNLVNGSKSEHVTK